MKKKALAVVATLLVVCCAIGGTLAYLSYKSDDVTNVFTVGDIDVNFKETTGEEYKMVPGAELAKDPTFTIGADSEACYLFAKIQESDNFATFLEYSVDDTWTALGASYPNVYYIEVPATESEVTFGLLEGNKVTVKNLTKEELAAAKGNEPTLTFTGYAIQKDGFDTAEDAWLELNKEPETTTTTSAE